MKNLRKRGIVADSVEAYVCMCAYAACSCTCACVCVCQVGNPTATDNQNDITGAYNPVTNYTGGDSANGR
ncbi:hypothetical protein [Clostridium sp. Marseille-P299]|uniref:hypothetical protein n=1 Tax=Clostridium sp. Marseille-P299 TaxID=1805477 RepID=UPI0008372468|nr:hypothetical protein [Clostridium sp. Marseille-P299]